MCKKRIEFSFFIKRYVCQLCVAPQTRQHTPLLCILRQNIEGKCIFSHSLAMLANMAQDKKVYKRTPPAVGGLIGDF